MQGAPSRSETSAAPVPRRSRGIVGILIVAVALAAGIALAAKAVFADPAPSERADLESRLRQGGSGATPSALLEGLDLRRARSRDGALEADLADGRRAKLTLDPDLQRAVKRLLARYELPYASVVAMEPTTGRVLAYVSHSSANPSAPDLALDGSPPAASVFKIVTGSALVDAGVDPDARVCYGGGFNRLELADLEENQSRDRWCSSLAGAMGSSINAIFARLALRHLTPQTLGRYARAFGFGEAIPFDLPTRANDATVPEDRLEFARTSAGFWHMHLSPLHGAVLGSTIASRGLMLRPQIIDEVRAADGSLLHRSTPVLVRRVLAEQSARIVNRMMRRTVTEGTSRRTFFDPQGVAFLPGIEIAGKTGTLNGSNPFRGYTWWVGFAPADAPRIALAVLVVNTPIWRVKANFVARETLRAFFGAHPVHGAADAGVHATDAGVRR
ncbi:MAG: penicillin-binding protein [Deltaproteobacteria bacterium]|nr:penicillin-binding protein [Deltaproteobacteria bacterium]